MSVGGGHVKDLPYMIIYEHMMITYTRSLISRNLNFIVLLLRKNYYLNILQLRSGARLGKVGKG